MTDTTFPGDHVNLFAGEYAGVRLSEDEFGRWTAYGHVSAEDMKAGMRAWQAEFQSDDLTEDVVPVEHVWAVLNHEDGARDDEGWYFTWKDVTEQTPQAFPLTVVPSL